MKISQDRIRIDLKTRQIAEDFIKTGSKIEIIRKKLYARWYVQEKTDKR